MMGERTVMQEALFYSFGLEPHVPADHLLRSIDRFVDLSHVRQPCSLPQLLARSRTCNATTLFCAEALDSNLGQCRCAAQRHLKGSSEGLKRSRHVGPKEQKVTVPHVLV